MNAAADRLRADIGDLSDRVSQRLLAEVRDLGEEPELGGDVSATVRASVLGWLDFLRLGQPAREIAVPAEALALTRTFALRGASSELLLRMYRLGHGLVFREWMAALRAEGPSPELMDELMGRSLDLSFAYVDSISIPDRRELRTGACAPRAERRRDAGRDGARDPGG